MKKETYKKRNEGGEKKAIKRNDGKEKIEKKKVGAEVGLLSMSIPWASM